MKLFARKKPGPGHEVDPGFPVIDKLHYRQVLAGMNDRIRPDWYLEIGARDGRSLAECSCNYIAVDPEFQIRHDVFNHARSMIFMQQTSDDFFESGFLHKTGIVPDFTFVDGMHHFEFALRDFMNAEKAMHRDGVIAFHDVCPHNLAMTTRDTDYMTVQKKPWTGDVWKTMAILLEYRPDLRIDILSAAGTGLGCVTQLDPGNRVLDDHYDAIVARYVPMELSDIGVGAYYGTFDLRDPQAYLDAIAPKN